MTDEQFLETLTPDKRYWWSKMIKKHGSIEAVKETMSGYTKRRKTIVGFRDPEIKRKAEETIKNNRKK